MIIKLDALLNSVRAWLEQHLPKVSAETLGWLAVVVIHCATIPTLLALLTGLSDTVPNLDVVLFMWAGLVLLFFRAVVLRDFLNIITIGLGFIVQAVIMAMITACVMKPRPMVMMLSMSRRTTARKNNKIKPPHMNNTMSRLGTVSESPVSRARSVGMVAQ